MLDTAYSTLSDADVILLLVSATDKEVGKGDKRILEKLAGKSQRVILVINKIDEVEKTSLLEVMANYKKEYPFQEIIPISALKQQGIEELLCQIEKRLPQGPAYYDKETYTDQTLRELSSEIIREKALKLLQDEVPHGILVEIEKMKTRKTKLNEPIYDIEATIYCIRNSHKGIIIGKNGSMLKKIGQYAREDLEKMLERKVNLKIWVKVKENWQDDEKIIKRFKPEK